MYEKIHSIAESITDSVIRNRRDFHHYAETAWFEIRTASLVARQLTELGFEVLVGKEVMNEDSRMGLPSQEHLDLQYERALSQGADREFAEQVKNGYTAVVGIPEKR